MIFSYFGPNSFLLQSALRQHIDEFVAKHGDFAVETIDAEEVEMARIYEATQNLPFLAVKKMIIIRGIAKNKQLTEDLEKTIEQVPDSIDVLFVETHPDKRTSWYKYLQKSTECRIFEALAQPQLLTWIQKRADELSTSIKYQDALFLLNRTGSDVQMLDGALQKMSVLEGPITKDMITTHVEPVLQSTVFELLDATLSGQTHKSLELYEDQRRQKVEPQAIWAMLLWQLHVLAVVFTAGKKNPSDIAKESGISPYVISKASSLTRRILLVRLKELVHLVRTIDVRLKTETIDADEAVRYVLVAIAN